MSQDNPISDLQPSERDEFLRRIQELEERCRRAEDALRTSVERNRLLGDSAPFGIIVVETEGLVFGANRIMLNMLAWPPDRDVTELNVLQHPPLVESGVSDSFLRCLDKKTRIVSDHSCPRITDGCEHLRYHISPVFEPDGRISGIIAFVEDVTELRVAEETIKASEKKYRLLFEYAPVAMKITSAASLIAIVDITKRKQAEEALRAGEQRFREQALRDNLTGLYNRRYLYQSLTDLIEHARAKGSVVSVIFMDLDRFKSVVDRYGHLNGSRTIKEVGATIRETLEKPAFAVAYAGDEFVVVLPDFDQVQAVEQANKIQDRIRNHVFLRDQGFEVSIRSSFGVATFPYHADDMTNLLATADQALFGAKGAGKDTVKSA